MEEEEVLLEELLLEEEDELLEEELLLDVELELLEEEDESQQSHTYN